MQFVITHPTYGKMTISGTMPSSAKSGKEIIFNGNWSFQKTTLVHYEYLEFQFFIGGKQACSVRAGWNGAVRGLLYNIALKVPELPSGSYPVSVKVYMIGFTPTKDTIVPLDGDISNPDQPSPGSRVFIGEAQGGFIHVENISDSTTPAPSKSRYKITAYGIQAEVVPREINPAEPVTIKFSFAYIPEYVQNSGGPVSSIWNDQQTFKVNFYLVDNSGQKHLIKSKILIGKPRYSFGFSETEHLEIAPGEYKPYYEIFVKQVYDKSYIFEGQSDHDGFIKIASGSLVQNYSITEPKKYINVHLMAQMTETEMVPTYTYPVKVYLRWDAVGYDYGPTFRVRAVLTDKDGNKIADLDSITLNDKRRLKTSSGWYDLQLTIPEIKGGYYKVCFIAEYSFDGLRFTNTKTACYGVNIKNPSDYFEITKWNVEVPNTTLRQGEKLLLRNWIYWEGSNKATAFRIIARIGAFKYTATTTSYSSPTIIPIEIDTSQLKPGDYEVKLELWYDTEVE